MIIKKTNRGKYVTLLVNFALEPSENFKSVFSLNLLCWLHRLQTGVAQSFFVPFYQIMHNIEGILRENVKKNNICSLWLILPAQVIYCI